ncbi:hypothetical protein DFR47_11344 [Pseudochrobactrum asaccharolyticum]|uniref:Uncharacterized protein n=1 Tax=Pseudochrobactrum asaccharolyticum TaxID=354351 RepID=A0A366DK80_9HYPH|nr:hypothetical protein DFR47_11344 [Pseudochrobactrum asaccharolyticum]
MDRNLILSRIVGPIREFGRPSTLEWRFMSKRKKKFGIDSRCARSFTLRYDPHTRKFSATCHRYISKRIRPQKVKVSASMTEHLRSKLSGKTIARIMAASIINPPPPRTQTMSGYQLHVHGQSWPIHNMKLPSLKG